MIALLVVLAFALGFGTGWNARRMFRRKPKPEDRTAGLRRYQDHKGALHG